MTSLLFITITMADGSTKTMKFQKRWTKAIGKRRAQRACANCAVLMNPNYQSLEMKWGTDIHMEEDPDNKSIVFNPLCIESRAMLAAQAEALRLTRLQAADVWRHKYAEHEAALLLTALRRAGLGVSFDL